MKRLLKHLKSYIKETVLGPLFKLFEATLELIVPLVIAMIIDNGIELGDTGYVIRASLVLFLLGAVGLVFSVVAQYFAAKASVGYVAKLRFELFSHLQTLSCPEIDKLGTSTMIARLTSDSNQVQTGLNLALRLLLRSPFVVFGAMVMAFTIDTRSALTFVAELCSFPYPFIKKFSIGSIRLFQKQEKTFAEPELSELVVKRKPKLRISENVTASIPRFKNTLEKYHL